LKIRPNNKYPHPNYKRNFAVTFSCLLVLEHLYSLENNTNSTTPNAYTPTSMSLLLLVGNSGVMQPLTTSNSQVLVVVVDPLLSYFEYETSRNSHRHSSRFCSRFPITINQCLCYFRRHGLREVSGRNFISKR